MAVHAGNLILLGGIACLDFTNTLEGRSSENPHEYLTGYADLIAWSVHAGTLRPEAAADLSQTAEASPGEAQAAFERAIALRETLQRIFAAVASGDAPRAKDLGTFNAALTEALAHLHVSTGADGFAWHWAGEGQILDRHVWPLLWTAADLLTSEDLDRVKQCEGCGWLFLDGSRNHSRRWCDMRFCGNRAKARRHYARQKKK